MTEIEEAGTEAKTRRQVSLLPPGARKVYHGIAARNSGAMGVLNTELELYDTLRHGVEIKSP